MPRKSPALLCEQDPETLTSMEKFRLMSYALRDFRKPYFRVFRSERPACGATCRDGHACKAPAMLEQMYGCEIRNGRCRNHGGLSTGARTPEGKAKVDEARRLRWQRYREAQLLSTSTGSS